MTRFTPKTPLIMGRRSFLSAAGATAATAGMGGLIAPGRAWASDFPSRNLDIIIPTGEGGGADRDARAFASVWQRHLGRGFQFSFYPGAAGQVGYDFFMQRDPDAYTLIFANLGPEVIMLELQDTGIHVGDDIVYVQQTLSEPMAVWVGPNSPFHTLEDLIEEGRRRTITCSTSRLPHPASIGMLAMAEAMGIEITLVPYGGGNPTAMAAITQEVDCAALPITNTIVLGDQARVLGVFADENVVPDDTDNAPTVNAALGTEIPELTSSRAWGVHRAAMEAHPERVATLVASMEATLADPDYTAAVEGTGVPTVFIDPGDQERAMATAQATIELARRFRDLLTGS